MPSLSRRRCSPRPSLRRGARRARRSRAGGSHRPSRPAFSRPAHDQIRDDQHPTTKKARACCAGRRATSRQPARRYISHFPHKCGTLGQLKLSIRPPSSGLCRSQTTSTSNDVPRLAAPLLRPTTCPTPSRGRQEQARATTSGTRGRRACGGTTSRTNRTRAERRVSRAPAAATPPPSAADGGRESTRRGATRPSPSRLPPAAPRGVGCTALRDGPGGGERDLSRRHGALYHP